jgi:hypothetical protein
MSVTLPTGLYVESCNLPRSAGLIHDQPKTPDTRISAAGILAGRQE